MTPFAAMIVATGTGSEAAPPPLPPPSPAMLLLVLLLSLGIQPAMSARNSAAHHSEIIESIDGTASDATTHSPPRPPPPPGLPLALLPVLLVRLMVRVLLALLLKERVRMGEAVTSCGHKNALPFRSPYLHNISMCSFPSLSWQTTAFHNRKMAWRATFCAIYIYNASFYQDRLGTNIGKALKKECAKMHSVCFPHRAIVIL